MKSTKSKKDNPTIEIIYKKQRVNPYRPEHIEMEDAIETMKGCGMKKIMKPQIVVKGSIPV